MYKPGKELFIVDTLRRAPSPRLFQDDVTQGCEEQVNATLDTIIPLDSTRTKFAAATAADPLFSWSGRCFVVDGLTTRLSIR